MTDRRHGHRHDRGRRRHGRGAATPTRPRPAPTTPSLTTAHGADGDDQPGRRPGRSDEQRADQLHRGVQRAGHRLRRRATSTLSGTAGGDQRRSTRERRRTHLQRRGQRHDDRRHRHRLDRRPAWRRTRRATPTRPRPAPTTRHVQPTTPRAPTVTINQAGGQADPTNSVARSTSPWSSARRSPASPAATSRSAARRAAPRRSTVTGSGTTYNVAVSGMTDQRHRDRHDPAGVATDARGQRQHRLDQHRQHGHVHDTDTRRPR